MIGCFWRIVHAARQDNRILPILEPHLQIAIKYLCGTQEWWRYMLHECCLPAAFHAALHTQDAAVST